MSVPHRPDRVLATIVGLKALVTSLVVVTLVRASSMTATVAREMRTPDRFLRDFPAADRAAMRADDAMLADQAHRLTGGLIVLAVALGVVALLEIAIASGLWRGRRWGFRGALWLEGAFVVLSLVSISVLALPGVVLSLVISVSAWRRLRDHGRSEIVSRDEAVPTVR